MINTAVILAAGRGSRLGTVTEKKPKGFVEIDNIPIIERSIRKLIFCGMESIIIGTGYHSEFYDELAEKYSIIKCIRNNDFQQTGSMKTLVVASQLINDDFLLLESDLVYDIAALKLLLNSSYSDSILVSNPSGSMDEVFVETDSDHKLVALSKNREMLKSVDGELVGISRVSLSCLKKLCEYEQKMRCDHPKLDYEHAFAGIQDTRFHVEMAGDLVWCEIDNQSHFDRAVNTIYPRVCESECKWDVKRNVLLNPGPATTTDSVKYAQIVPDICPREREFGSLISWICRKLSDIADSSGSTVTTLFGGSGTAAMESIISSVISNGHLVVVNNGAYGQRICDIAGTYDISYSAFTADPFYSVDPESLRAFIDSIRREHKVTHIAVVHHETTTGVLNDIGTIGKICAENNIELIVDAISSFAAVPIDMVKMNISHLASTSNKNLQGMAGVGFVVSRKASIEKLKDIRSRSYYLDLYNQFKYLELHNQTRFTPPVQTLYALKQAIIETISEGVANRYKRYTKSWETLIGGLKDMGLGCPVPIKDQSHLLTSIYEPEVSNYDFDKMHDYLLSKGFTIYPGKISSSRTFRIANIGAITPEDIKQFINELQDYLNQITKCGSQRQN